MPTSPSLFKKILVLHPCIENLTFWKILRKENNTGILLIMDLRNWFNTKFFFMPTCFEYLRFFIPFSKSEKENNYNNYRVISCTHFLKSDNRKIPKYFSVWKTPKHPNEIIMSSIYTTVQLVLLYQWLVKNATVYYLSLHVLDHHDVIM